MVDTAELIVINGNLEVSECFFLSGPTEPDAMPLEKCTQPTFGENAQDERISMPSKETSSLLSLSEGLHGVILRCVAKRRYRKVLFDYNFELLQHFKAMDKPEARHSFERHHVCVESLYTYDSREMGRYNSSRGAAVTMKKQKRTEESQGNAKHVARKRL